MDLLEQLMFAADLPVAKPRYRLIDGEWQNTTPPAPIEEKWVCDTDDHDDDGWATCGAPVVNKPCPKCKGTTEVVFHDRRVQTCHWCTDGAGVITGKDKRNYDRRIFKGLAICSIMTTA
jgi:hypothetical protein